MRTIMRRPWLLVGILGAAALVAQLVAAQGRNFTFTNANLYSPPVPAAGASGDLFNITSTILAMDAAGGDVVRGMALVMTNADHTGGTLYGLDIGAIVGDDQAVEYAINLGADWDASIYIPDGSTTDDLILFGDDTDAGIYWANGGVALYIDAGQFGTGGNVVLRGTANAGALVADINGGSSIFAVRNQPAGGSSGNLIAVTETLAAMNGADTVRGLFLDYTNGAHTATDTFYGIDIDDIVDSAANETAINIQGGWDVALYTAGDAPDIDHGITAHVQLSPTLAANDNASDQRNVLMIDVDVPNGSAGLVNAINIDGITDDVNTIDAAIFVEGGWDAAIHMTEKGGVATTNALANSVMMYVDDNADYSGAGGNDCAVVFRDAGGNMGSVIVNLNAACP